MKKFAYLALTLITILGCSNIAIAGSNDLPVIDSTTPCLIGEHIHAEDVVGVPDNALSISPRGDIHCHKNGQVGHIISSSTTQTLGSETRNCAHGRVGGIDKRIKYQKITKQSCSLCSFTNVITGTPYWGSWVCQ